VSEQQRQRRLHVQNRLEELNAKYGPVDEATPETYEEAVARLRAERAAEEPPETKRALQASEVAGIEPTRILGVQE
jgi:hypothetical protein